MTDLSQSTADPAHVAADILSEFLEVAIHGILYTRGIYPAGVFEKRKKYNIPVQMCLHPDVSQYVAKVVDSIKLLMKQNSVDKVSMVILNSQQEPLERFVFELTRPVKPTGSDKHLYQLEQSLRAFLLKVNVSDALLKPIPEDCTWTVHVHTKESTAQQMEQRQLIQDFPWVEADDKETALPDPRMVPLKTMSTDLIKMQLVVEESSKKPS